jgi:SAM-dependent methyltransferase
MGVQTHMRNRSVGIVGLTPPVGGNRTLFNAQTMRFAEAGHPVVFVERSTVDTISWAARRLTAQGCQAVAAFGVGREGIHGLAAAGTAGNSVDGAIVLQPERTQLRGIHCCLSRETFEHISVPSLIVLGGLAAMRPRQHALYFESAAVLNPRIHVEAMPLPQHNGTPRHRSSRKTPLPEIVAQGALHGLMNIWPTLIRLYQLERTPGPRINRSRQVNAILDVTSLATLWSLYSVIFEEVQVAFSPFRDLAMAHEIAIRGRRVLDIGAGAGDLAYRLARGHEVTAVEPNDIMAAKLWQRVRDLPNVTVVPRPLSQSKVFRGTRYDTINAANVIQYLPDPEAFLRQAALHGDRLVISGAVTNAYPSEMVERISREMIDGDLEEQLKWKVNLMGFIHRRLKQEMRTFTLDEIVKLVRIAGFENIVTDSDQFLGGQSFFVVADRGTAFIHGVE